MLDKKEFWTYILMKDLLRCIYIMQLRLNHLLWVTGKAKVAQWASGVAMSYEYIGTQMAETGMPVAAY